MSNSWFRVEKPLQTPNGQHRGMMGLSIASDIPTAIWVVSFPKCGRTWLRALVGRYLTHAFDLSPEISMDTTWLTTALLAVGRAQPLAFTHAGSEEDGPYFSKIPELMFPLNKCKVIFVIRDLRDMVVSWYFERVKRAQPEDWIPYKGTISDFIRDESVGCPKIITFLNYWLAFQVRFGCFSVLAYELMHKKPELVLNEALRLIIVKDIKEESVKEAVRWSKFDNLKKLESQDYWKGLATMTARDVNDPETYKMRKGKIGGYKDYLSLEDIEYVESQMVLNLWQRMYLEGKNV